MSDFINTIDALGDDVVMDSIIDRSITEFKDNTLTKIGDYAFYKCKALSTVDLPNVTSAGDYVFTGCSALSTVDLPKLTRVGRNFFQGCSLSSVNLPSVTSVGSAAFNGCGLKYLYLPEAISTDYTSFTGAFDKLILPKVTIIESQCFRYGGTHNIIDLGACTTIYCHNFLDSTICNHLILRTGSVCAISTNNPNINNVYVPSALIEEYKVATNWVDLYTTNPDIFHALEDYTVDGTTTGEFDETKI